MASIDTLSGRKFETVEEELEYWKQSYMQLAARTLICFKCSVVEEPPAEKPRIEEDGKVFEMDPLKLPEPCADAILEHFTGKELLIMTEVSKFWKDYIESSKRLFSRAMDHVVFSTPDVEKFDPKLLYNMFSQSKREYKHLIMSYPLKLNLSTKYQGYSHVTATGYYARTLETLKMKCAYLEIYSSSTAHGCYVVMPYNFYNLRMLIIECSGCISALTASFHQPFQDFILSSYFPKVTHLKITGMCGSLDIGLVYRFPQLHTLWLEEINDMVAVELPYTRKDRQPKIQQLALPVFYEEVVFAFFDTLVELHISSTIAAFDFNVILMNLRRLHSLAFKKLRYTPGVPIDFVFTKHKRLKILKTEIDNSNSLHRVLHSLPFISQLILFKCVKDKNIIFMARKMRYLQKLTCKKITVNARQTYRSIVKNQKETEGLVNTHFALSRSSDLQYEDFCKKFD